MKTVESNILRFLQGAKQFIIPIYQRMYSWDRKQCEQLWNDIVRTGQDENIQGHFLGFIVYIQSGIYQSSSVLELLVIDGQQRLTSISLLLKALVNALNGRMIDGDVTSKKITNYYLLNNDEENELRMKLVLTQIDKNTLFDLIEGKEPDGDYSKRIVKNYKFFQEQMIKSGIDLNILYRGIKKLFIIDVSLERGKDNPQLIFESMNSTGLELSQADLIRNYILIGLKPKDQDYIYNEYWASMEKDFEQEDFIPYFNRFMRDFLTIKLGKIPNIDEVYSEFKSYLATRKNDSIENIVKEIRYYSQLFVKFAYGKEKTKTYIKQ